MTDPHRGPETAPDGGFVHEPVMVSEVVEALLPAAQGDIAGGLVLDATIGGGGHAMALLGAAPGARLLGIDRDRHALEAAARRLAPFGDRVTLRQAPFERLAAVAADLGVEAIAAFLFDLGVSSPQLDVAERGFSYRHEGPLDMRMDRMQSLTAADVVNGYDVRRLAHVLRQYGDERFADRIARAIVAARPLETTTQLAAVVRDAIPAATRRRGGHPATRTFQALRIEVNRELDQLPRAIDDAIDLLAAGGRGAVIAYHSGEDRLVKERFVTAATGGCTCPPGLPCACGAVPTVRLVRRGAIKPSAAEVERNPRAASARLRVVEKLPAAA